MIALPEPICFDWNKGNIDKNLKKHGITNKESEEVFTNRPFIASLDKKHSSKHERRYQALGKTDNNKILFLSFTIRIEKIRVISARKANTKERKAYEKKH